MMSNFLFYILIIQALFLSAWAAKLSTPESDILVTSLPNVLIAHRVLLGIYILGAVCSFFLTVFYLRNKNCPPEQQSIKWRLFTSVVFLVYAVVHGFEIFLPSLAQHGSAFMFLLRAVPTVSCFLNYLVGLSVVIYVLDKPALQKLFHFFIVLILSVIAAAGISLGFKDNLVQSTPYVGVYCQSLIQFLGRILVECVPMLGVLIVSLLQLCRRGLNGDLLGILLLSLLSCVDAVLWYLHYAFIFLQVAAASNFALLPLLFIISPHPRKVAPPEDPENPDNQSSSSKNKGGIILTNGKPGNPSPLSSEKPKQSTPVSGQEKSKSSSSSPSSRDKRPPSPTLRPASKATGSPRVTDSSSTLLAGTKSPSLKTPTRLSFSTNSPPAKPSPSVPPTSSETLNDSHGSMGTATVVAEQPRNGPSTPPSATNFKATLGTSPATGNSPLTPSSGAKTGRITPEPLTPVTKPEIPPTSSDEENQAEKKQFSSDERQESDAEPPVEEKENRQKNINSAVFKKSLAPKPVKKPKKTHKANSRASSESSPDDDPSVPSDNRAKKAKPGYATPAKSKPKGKRKPSLSSDISPPRRLTGRPLVSNQPLRQSTRPPPKTLRPVVDNSSPDISLVESSNPSQENFSDCNDGFVSIGWSEEGREDSPPGTPASLPQNGTDMSGGWSTALRLLEGSNSERETDVSSLGPEEKSEKILKEFRSELPSLDADFKSIDDLNDLVSRYVDILSRCGDKLPRDKVLKELVAYKVGMELGKEKREKKKKEMEKEIEKEINEEKKKKLEREMELKMQKEPERPHLHQLLIAYVEKN